MTFYKAIKTVLYDDGIISSPLIKKDKVYEVEENHLGIEDRFGGFQVLAEDNIYFRVYGDKDHHLYHGNYFEKTK